MSAPARTTHEEQPIAYDVSPDMHDLRLLCADCSDEVGDEHGAAMYDGDEWGGDVPDCYRCGCEIVGLTVVPS